MRPGVIRLSGRKQFAWIISACDAPERIARESKLSPARTVVGSQPAGTRPHRSGSGELMVAMGVGCKVAVGVGLSRGMAGKGVLLAAMMVALAMAGGGEGDGGSGRTSACASKNANSTVPTTPRAINKLHCHLPVSCVSSSIANRLALPAKRHELSQNGLSSS